MLKLCGFHLSNYHNKVRLALLEKGLPFEEDPCSPSQKDEWLARSPMGKVPILELDGGRRIAESEVILEYLEEAYPQKPLLPKDPYERAKVRELVQRDIDAVNLKLAKFETIKKFYICPEEFTIDGGLLTPSLKVKKKVALERYKAEIDAMYAGGGGAES
jgi:glutathione S-transferase